jgi:hypothetical protein
MLLRLGSRTVETGCRVLQEENDLKADFTSKKCGIVHHFLLKVTYA